MLVGAESQVEFDDRAYLPPFVEKGTCSRYRRVGTRRRCSLNSIKEFSSRRRNGSFGLTSGFSHETSRPGVVKELARIVAGVF